MGRLPDDRGGMRRVLPAFTLFLMAPLVAEFLLGNLPITWLFTLVLLAPMYLLTWPGVAVQVAPAVLVAHFSQSTRWTPRHTVALAGGALLTYAWHGFPEDPVVPVSPMTDLVGNAVFAAAALALLAVALRRNTTLRACPVST